MSDALHTGWRASAAHARPMFYAAGLVVCMAFTLMPVQQLWHACVLLIIAPLAEETIFRAGVQDMLLRRSVSPHTSNALTALVFALAHVLVYQNWAGLSVLLPALVMGEIYARWRRLTPCILMHSIMNACWLLA